MWTDPALLIQVYFYNFQLWAEKVWLVCYLMESLQTLEHMTCLQTSSLHYWVKTAVIYITFLCLFFPQLEKKEVTPPFKPQISDDYGLENFDTQFTNEPVQLTPDDE